MAHSIPIAWRFLLKGTDKGTLSPMTVFVWLALGVGIAAMSVLLSVMYGFEGALRDRVLTAFPHIIVKAKEETEWVSDYKKLTQEFKRVEGIATVLPYIETEMIFRSDYRTLGGVVRGISYEDFKSLQPGIKKGALPKPNSKIGQAVVGSELAHRLGLAVGETIKVISPLRKSGAMGLAPEAETFEVSAIYTSGHYEFDQQYIFIPIEDAQDLLHVGDVITGWHLWANDISQAERLEPFIGAMLPNPLKAESWRIFNAALFDSLKLEQFSMSLILNFAILIAVMNVVITLMMHVAHKKRNIGILRALGASQKQIRNIFLAQGFLMGAVGLVIGAGLSFVLIVYLKYFCTFQLPDIYYDRTIPVEIRPVSLAMIYIVASGMICLATLYPAIRAAKLDPIEAIRE